MTKFYASYTPERKETLEDHIIYGMAFIKWKYLDKNYHKYLSARLKSFYIEIDPYLSADIVMAAYFLHDSGKAFIPLQNNIKMGHGAPGHEVLSAILSLKSIKIVANIPEEVKRNLKNSIACAIILHMSALRSPIEGINVLLRNKSYIFSKNAARFFRNLVKKSSWKWRGISFDFKEFQVNTDDIRQLINNIAPIFAVYKRNNRRFIPYFLLTNLLVHPVIMADEFSASLASNKSPRPWAREFINSI
ncbi:MAG: hypothetical protein ACTSXX_05725 [Candidatus Baldrarchaeia archaeon]